MRRVWIGVLWFFAVTWGLAAGIMLLSGHEPFLQRLGPAAVAALFSAIAGWGIGRLNRNQAEVPKGAELLIEETMAFFEHVNAQRVFPPAQADRILSKPKAPLLAVCNARLFEMHVSRATQHVGTRLKLGGVPIYLGQSVPVSKSVMREASQGELGVTAKTLIFVGVDRSIDVKLDSVTSVEILADGFRLTAQGRVKPLTFVVSNGLLWAMLVRNLIALDVSGNRLPDDGVLQAR